MRQTVWSLLLLILLFVPLGAVARPPAGAAPTTGFRADFLRLWDELEKKFVSLAQAMPQEKYTWRPAAGVRSVSEVYLHVAGANFGFMTVLGVPSPVALDRSTFEKSSTDQAKVVEYLKLSFEHVRQAVLKIPDADLDKPTTLFGRDSTVREVLFTLATHQPEHLGQSIAYARINGVVPPWTAERQTRQQKPR